MTDAGFDLYSDNYDAVLEGAIGVSGESRAFFARGRVAWLAQVMPRLNERPTVLDFGCGTGSSAPLLLELVRATQVIGVDTSARTIETARRTHAGERVSFSTTDEYVPHGEMDVAYCNGVFHHVPPAARPAAVDYVYRALRPGGVFALWENNPWNPATRFVMSRCPFDRDAVLLRPSETRELLRTRGFEILRTDFLFIFPRALRALRGLEPRLSRWPLGTQYQVLCRRSATTP